MSAPAKEMQIVAQRIATFQQPHQLSKRRASSQSKKKGATTIEWPHKKPDPEALARAGFFYRPAPDSTDNVQCFLCTVKLDGWEPEDDPIQEHLAHSDGCAWATSLSVQREDEDARGPEMRDPLSEEMLNARMNTFITGDGWPHETKKGWKCKITKLAEAGWAWDPSAEGEESDGATCFYCNLSLDGWEPKDDPFLEHKRRVPECRFFELLELYHGPEAAAGKLKKTKAKGKAGSRASTTSKASRMSAQSVVSEAPSMPGSYVDTLRDSSLAGVDDSVVTTTTTASQATATGAKGKKGGRKKAAATGAKGKKTQSNVPLDESQDTQSTEVATQQTFEPESFAESNEAPPQATRGTRKTTRASKQVDSSVIEISQIETAPVKKAARGRKAKAQPQEEPEEATVPETPDATAIAEKRLSEVSAQLQQELENSVDDFAPMDESTPAAEPAKIKRGTKRTSDGLRKQPEPQPNLAEQPKRPRGRPKKSSGISISAVTEAAPRDLSIELGDHDADSSTRAAPKKGRGRPKGKKASTNSSARSSKATVLPQAGEHEEQITDEMEIEQELERLASEEAALDPISTEQNEIDQFETSPSQGRISKDSAELQRLQVEIQTEDAVQDGLGSLPQEGTEPAVGSVPSPNGSDKENQPSSPAKSSRKPQPSAILSPTKTVRIPLAASTPNRTPGKALLSPSKQISHLTSSAPWTAVDLDTVLLGSPQPTPGRLGQSLVNATGALTSPEKRMNVEQWIRFRADKGEEELKRRCEQMVAAFEKEGMRGVESLRGIDVVA